MDANDVLRLKLYDCLHKGTDVLLETAGQLLDNPIILTTASYKVIALINTTGLDNPDEIWQFAQKHGYCSADAINEFRQAGITSAVHESAHPTMVDFSVGEQIPRVIGRIDIEGKTVAYMGLFQIKKPITEMDYQMVESLCQVLAIEFKQNPYNLDTSDSIQEDIIRDLLANRLFGFETLYDRLRSAKWHILPLFTVVAIPLNRSDSSSYFKDYLKRGIQSVIPMSKIIERDDILIILLNSHKEENIEFACAELNTILEQNKLHAGASRIFYNLLDLPRYYQQAVKTVDIAFRKKEKDHRVYLYDDDLFSHLLSELPQQYTFSEIISPAFNHLKRHDEKYDTALVKTLILYLEQLGNINATAKALFIHRNTLRARLAKIQEIVGDIKDNQTWFDIYISAKIDAWYNV